MKKLSVFILLFILTATGLFPQGLGVNLPSDKDIVNAFYNILIFFGVITVLFGSKKYIESFVMSFIIIYNLRRQGKIAEGLKIRFQGYEGVITEIERNKIKIDLTLHKDSNKTGKNFLIVPPKEIYEKTIEVVIE